jgi:hypothetical protein
MKRTLLAVVGVVLVMAACGTTARPIGEACVVEGATAGECESGAICGKDPNDVLACLKICDYGSTADAGKTDAGAAPSCSADQECNGVSGSTIKACRDKKK